MTVQNLTTARFVLQCLLDELEEYDRCTPVARDVQVGDVADALLTILSDRELRRLSMPKIKASPRGRRMARSVRTVVAKQASRPARVARKQS
jgi:hypothetical protein